MDFFISVLIIMKPQPSPEQGSAYQENPTKVRLRMSLLRLSLPAPVITKFAYSLSPNFLFSPSTDFVYTRETSLFYDQKRLINLKFDIFRDSLIAKYGKTASLANRMYAKVNMNHICNVQPSS